MKMSTVQARCVHLHMTWPDAWRSRAACKVADLRWVLVDDPDAVTCARCRATKAWRVAMQRKQSNAIHQ